MQVIIKNYRLIVAVLVASSLVILLYLVFGFGKITFDYSSPYSAAYINKIFIGNHVDNVKARPGKYSVTISEPSSLTTKTITVLPFSNAIVSSEVANRDINTDVINAALYNPAQVKVTSGKLIDEVWYAGLFESPSSTNVFGAKFENGSWTIVYTGYTDTPEFESSLPANVKNYLKEVSHGQLVKNGL